MRDYSKTVKQNIRNYIIKNYDPDGYDPTKFFIPADTSKFEDVAKSILQIFRAEKSYYFKNPHYIRTMSENKIFLDWCQGLPSVLDTCYFYNREAVDDLSDILKEPYAVIYDRFEDDTAAGYYLTDLIFRELQDATKKGGK